MVQLSYLQRNNKINVLKILISKHVITSIILKNSSDLELNLLNEFRLN